ncbi:MAG: ChbG/HpnK family deacetylase [Microthrixaceae bacterium]
MTLLLVTADDYALTEGISRGVIKAHRGGLVTGTSVLALGPAFERCMPWLLEEANLDIGVHLAAVGEDPPLLSSAEIPTLVDRRGRLPTSWKHFLARWRSIDAADLHRELSAQIARISGMGVAPTHLDAHQHLQLVPGFASVVIDLAQSWQIAVVRVPGSHRRTPMGVSIRALSRQLGKSVRRNDLTTTEAFAGLDSAGSMDHDRLCHALRVLARSGVASAELNVHPGLERDPERHRYDWRYNWGQELAALTSPEVAKLAENLGLRPGRRADLISSG